MVENTSVGCGCLDNNGYFKRSYVKKDKKDCMYGRLRNIM